MKVLLVSLFHPELVRGGAQQICYELFEGLKELPGVEPTLLAAVDPSFPSLYKLGARIVGFDGRANEYLYLRKDYDYRWHKSMSSDQLEHYADFLRLVQPDVVHFHHFLLYGIEILTLTRRVLPNARIVFTFHEFLTMCAADGQMVRTTDGSLCDGPSAVKCHQCFPERGPEDFFLRELWFKRHLASADIFTTPSRFMIDYFVRWGLDADKIVQVTNGQRDYNAAKPLVDTLRPKRNRFGFFGQMVDNKGVLVLLKAAQLLRSQGFTDFSIEINGDNLQYASNERRQEIEAFRDAEKELPPRQQLVSFNGSYHVDQLPNLMNRVDWCVVPSIWREVFGLVISEAWMFKRPIIASNVGGPAERITNEVDGLLFNTGDATALAETIRRACTEKGLWELLVAGIKPPPARDTMVAGYMKLYGEAAASATG